MSISQGGLKTALYTSAGAGLKTGGYRNAKVKRPVPAATVTYCRPLTA